MVCSSRMNLLAFRPGIGGMLPHGLQVTGVLGFAKEFLVSFRIFLHGFLRSFVFLFPAFDGNIQKKMFFFHREQSECGVGFKRIEV